LDLTPSCRVLRFEKALRERATLLQTFATNPQWITAVENILSTEGVAITASRREIISAVNQALQESRGAFPKATLVLKGEIEALLDRMPAVQVEEVIRERLWESRSQDAATSTTSFGCHRSDLKFYHAANASSLGREAALCSTGEQKALLISVTLAAARLQSSPSRPSFLLLDEVASHLDPLRRQALFEEILSLTWITGTDDELFEELIGKAAFFRIQNAQAYSTLISQKNEGCACSSLFPMNQEA